MKEQIDRITERIINAGLASAGNILFCLNKRGIYGKLNCYDTDILIHVLEDLDRDVLLVCTPSEPYRTMINYLADTSAGFIYPGDYETRHFLSDIPVIGNFSEQEAASALRKRRGAVICGGEIVTSSRSPETAYVTFSSICFACFVKFFSDYLRCIRKGAVDDKFETAFISACNSLDPMPEFDRSLMKGPFLSENDVLAAIEEAGKLVVQSRLVDSRFGNISFLKDRILYISRTGSFLDGLNGSIDAVNLELPDAVPPTVSSEFPVHREIVVTTGRHAVLHGHPKFSVILSMDCEVRDCKSQGSCQIMCPYERSVAGIPVVPGESGTGQYGLCHNLPPEMKQGSAVIVYGHGVFTAGADDFNEAFSVLLSTEKNCRSEYFRRLLV